jgi:hypothetical protein
MAYAQVSDVRGRAPSIQINAASVPSEGQVQLFLTEVEAELNAVLGNLGYTTPVAESATESRVLLKDLASTGALAKLLMARALGVDSSLLDSAKHVDKQYRDRLKALKSADDPFELPDATRTDGAPIKDPALLGESFADEGFTDFDIDEPRVTRAQVF